MKILNLRGNVISTDGKVVIEAPESDCGEVTFETKKMEYDNENDYSFHGTLIIPSNIQNLLCGCQEGEISVSSDEFGKSGRISLDSVTYEFHPLDENLIGIGKIDDTFFGNGECYYGYASEEDTGEEEESSQNKNVSNRTNGCVVRVLVLFSDNATSAPGITSLRTLARACTDITNQAFQIAILLIAIWKYD